MESAYVILGSRVECLRYGCRNNSLLALTSAPIADAAGLFSSKSKRALEISIYRGFGCLKALLPASASVAVNIHFLGYIYVGLAKESISRKS